MYSPIFVKNHHISPILRVTILCCEVCKCFSFAIEIAKQKGPKSCNFHTPPIILLHKRGAKDVRESQVKKCQGSADCDTINYDCILIKNSASLC